MIVLYALVFLSAVLLRQYEYHVAVSHALLVFLLASSHKKYEVIVALLTGIIFATTEYVCIRYFDMWKYNNTNYTIPIWLPFTWAAVGFFVIDLTHRLT